ncbi:hypothetical protein [Nitrososphaeria virus YSH_1032793]|uniref:Restriction endonuclease n=1 Tax=Nitrososphaeria virus YSH_1032793 TaxID=3071320 RepID=A0A976UBA1_9CAUD|nr:hypothetical protein QKV91_gp07 [Yangshan Harbor Nitrososphaeria virus]UVF62211.1 hypothetical protein [Nitrososphaeria virus YSH_1032793]
MSEKSFIHKAFRNNETGGTDFEIKIRIQEILKKYGISCIIPSQNEKYFGVRPDLIDRKNNFVLESNGSIHDKNKVILQDEFKVKTYKENKVLIGAISPDVIQYLIEIEASPLECCLVGILYSLKYSDGLKANF